MKLLGSIIGISIASLLFTPNFFQVASAQLKVPLLSRKCVSQNTRMKEAEVSIGRQFRVSPFSMQASGWDHQKGRLTCDLSKAKSPSEKRSLVFKAFQLEYGLSDTARESATVSVYLDGEPISVERVGKGQTKKLFLKVENVKSVAIETETGSSQQRVFILEADLL
jgi:hypothetical protein